ncbi:hypothetical protein B9Z55_007270 [Caenorhabditis nigoni]|uniref:Uncharacterized protein n=1 Tax=Caenorhabditis nigoni TaxID=1611254 RepID=A0A2G5V8Y4_9PELO|nr:hypothetical protein B9Z55_007270 [Caenorhabditis nigoni]
MNLWRKSPKFIISAPEGCRSNGPVISSSTLRTNRVCEFVTKESKRLAVKGSKYCLARIRYGSDVSVAFRENLGWFKTRKPSSIRGSSRTSAPGMQWNHRDPEVTESGLQNHCLRFPKINGQKSDEDG